MRNSFALLLALILTLAAAPAPAGPGPNPRIVNGENTQDHRTAGGLYYHGYPSCSGTLIGCETFLTAAHCVEGVNKRFLEVYLQHAGTFRVSEVWIHPEYRFPSPKGDVAVLRLSRPVFGVSPTPINRTDPSAFIPMSGRLVGFGATAGVNFDGGVKRTGLITTAHCTPETGGTDRELICWNFEDPIGLPGEDSNTCFGDSGGPLFMDFGEGTVVAGITSGGVNTSCLAADHSFDVNVANYADWIDTVGGSDIQRDQCGSPIVGEDGSSILSTDGILEGDLPQTVVVPVPDNTAQLRVAFNGEEGTQFEMRVKRGAPPLPGDNDCEKSGLLSYCEFDLPEPGDWYISLESNRDREFQLTATTLGGQPICGNGILEPTEICDGESTGSCEGPCTSTCECADPEPIGDFLCYAAQRARGSAPVPPSTLPISDEIESEVFRLSRPRQLCLPSSVDGGEIRDDATHLALHDARKLYHSPTNTRRSGLRLENRFGEFVVNMSVRDKALATSQVDFSSPVSAPDHNSNHVDSLKCYRTRIDRASDPFPRNLEVGTADALESSRYGVRPPSRLCFSSRMGDDGIKNVESALACHRVRRSLGEPRLSRALGVHVANLTGQYQVNTGKPTELCVATTVRVGFANRCEQAHPLTLPATISEDVSENTDAPGDPMNSCVRTERSAWFEFTADRTGTVVARTTGSNYDTVIGVYTGECGSHTEIACDDDTFVNAEAIFPVVAGEKYFIMVSNNEWQSHPPGTLQLEVSYEE